ncbi:hypothetical protein [Caballeronia zhejiangensis]|uniref:hypothetical protein n=1 Tax=Caballeronia zhejiangensis TaxID=871203 RepID=UPI001FD3C32E|nr:hypothetical protein [Caballeronia zhejiangensis]
MITGMFDETRCSFAPVCVRTTLDNPSPETLSVPRASTSSFACCLFANSAHTQQYPMLDAASSRLLQKYQQSSCGQSWQERAAKKGAPRSPAEEKVMQPMRNDRQMRAELINRVSAPIANKMFECGMIP